jgi:hypothetical protein
VERVAVVGDGPLAASLVEYLRARAFWVRATEPRGRAVQGVGHVYLLDTDVHLVGELLEAAVSAGVNRVLYALAPGAGTVDAVTPLLAKAAERGVETRFALLPNIYGPTDSVITDLATLAAGIPLETGPVVDIGADAEVPIEHIADVTVGLYLLMRSNWRRPLLIAGPDRYRLSDVAAELSRLAVRPLVTAPQGQPRLLQPGAAAQDVREALNWTPPTTLAAGLAHLVTDLSAGDPT